MRPLYIIYIYKYICTYISLASLISTINDTSFYYLTCNYTQNFCGPFVILTSHNIFENHAKIIQVMVKNSRQKLKCIFVFYLAEKKLFLAFLFFYCFCKLLFCLHHESPHYLTAGQC